MSVTATQIRVGASDGVGTDGGDSATTINVMINLTAIDSDISVAEHTACRNAQVSLAVAVNITACTATTTIDVAVPATLSSDTDGTAIHRHMGVALHVAIGRATINVSLDVGVVADDHMSVSHISLINNLSKRLC